MQINFIVRQVSAWKFSFWIFLNFPQANFQFCRLKRLRRRRGDGGEADEEQKKVERCMTLRTEWSLE